MHAAWHGNAGATRDHKRTKHRPSNATAQRLFITLIDDDNAVDYDDVERTFKTLKKKEGKKKR